MTTNARAKYEATAVGNTATLTLAPHQTIDEFQSEAREIRRMEEEGLVSVIDERKESMSGRRMITILMFKRLQ